MEKIDNQSFFTALQKPKWKGIIPHILLESPQSEENIGAIIRLADNIGVSKIYILNGRDYKWGKIKRNATTAYNKVKLIEIEEIDTILDGYDHVIGVDTLSGAEDIMAVETPKESCLLCYGNESVGMSEALAAKMQKAYYIPVLGQTYSLNLSQSVGISLYLYLKGQK